MPWILAAPFIFRFIQTLKRFQADLRVLRQERAVEQQAAGAAAAAEQGGRRGSVGGEILSEGGAGVAALPAGDLDLQENLLAQTGGGSTSFAASPSFVAGEPPGSPERRSSYTYGDDVRWRTAGTPPNALNSLRRGQPSSGERYPAGVDDPPAEQGTSSIPRFRPSSRSADEFEESIFASRRTAGGSFSKPLRLGKLPPAVRFEMLISEEDKNSDVEKKAEHRVQKELDARVTAAVLDGDYSGELGGGVEQNHLQPVGGGPSFLPHMCQQLFRFFPQLQVDTFFTRTTPGHVDMLIIGRGVVGVGRGVADVVDTSRADHGVGIMGLLEGGVGRSVYCYISPALRAVSHSFSERPPSRTRHAGRSSRSRTAAH